MKKNQRDLYVSGHSVFTGDSPFENKRHYHDENLSTISAQMIDKNKITIPNCKDCWYLDDYHLDRNENLLRKLRQVDHLSEQINAIEYEPDIEPPSRTYSRVGLDGDCLARKFFPVTLGQAYEMRSQLELPSNQSPSPWSVTFSPPPNGLPSSPTPWRVETAHNRAELRQNWRSTREHLCDSLHFVHHHRQDLSKPHHFTEDNTDRLDCIRTPYQAELSRLRLERLHLEEEILMEVKRQEEMHRIRGPTPKWYELRDSRFHFEARKNNELLRSCDDWQQLYNYSNKLTAKSEQFQRKYAGSYDPTNYVSVS